ncbi:cell wall integrity and stress response component 2 [Drosophila grimshawi]|uniref:cell wall integrity and stress response component 2 n=1 Tax=Drosophila grimshawi TaxID=7222 RepID=UPI000C871620|nr:cell wall integrity and stress response component 2 [Drosophila grimshawi]
MVAAAADVQVTATTAATLAATAATTTLTSGSIQFAALTAASASDSQASTSNLNKNNNNSNTNTTSSSFISSSIISSNHIDKQDCISSTSSSSSNSKNNNNMSDVTIDAAGADDATTSTTAAKTTTTTVATATVAATTTSAATATTAGVVVAAVPTKSAVSQRNVDIKIEKTSNMEAATKQLTKKVLKLDLGAKNLDEYSLKSPKSPIAARLPHQTSLTSSVDVEDRKTLREALYQGIFHRHRRTIFAVGSFLRMLRSRNSQYNTIRSSSEGEDIDEFLKARKLFKFPHLFDR